MKYLVPAMKANTSVQTQVVSKHQKYRTDMPPSPVRPSGGTGQGG